MTDIWRRTFTTVLVLVLGVAVLLPQTTYQGKEEKLPIEVAPQPVPFSHKTHVQAGMACQDCHADAARGERAGLPDSSRCMLCHQTIRPEHPAIQKLAQLHKKGSEGAGAIEWVRVYKVPGFVFFNHANHIKAGVTCGDCHGPVEQREVLAKERSTSMIACMNCHEQRNASKQCNLCHELGQ